MHNIQQRSDSIKHQLKKCIGPRVDISLVAISPLALLLDSTWLLLSTRSIRFIRPWRLYSGHSNPRSSYEIYSFCALFGKLRFSWPPALGFSKITLISPTREKQNVHICKSSTDGASGWLALLLNVCSILRST